MARDAQETPITELLARWRQGEQDALDRLLEAAYPELRRIAEAHFHRERSDHTLQATALVHEAYVRLIGQSAVDWQDRAHFFAVASRSMRRILVEHARARNTGKRKGVRVTFDDIHARSEGPDVDLLDLDHALTLLARDHPREAEVVHLRYFGGLTIAEAAAHLGLGHASVERAWTFARAWLARELGVQS